VKNQFFADQPIVHKGGFGEEDRQVGKTSTGTVPGASWGLVPHSDLATNKIFINDEFIKECDTTLNELVKNMGLTKTVENRDVAILEADINEPGGEFWSQFHYDIEHVSGEDGGYEVVAEDAKSILAIAAAMESPHCYFEGIEERPPTLADVKFIVHEKGREQISLVKGQASNGATLMRSLIKMSIEKKKVIAEAAGLPYGEDTDEETLDSIIFNAVQKDERVLVFGMEELYPFVLRIGKSEGDEVMLTRLVNFMRRKGVFSKDDRGFYTYDNNTYKMGETYADIVDYLKDPQNENALAVIFNGAKELGYKNK